MSRSSSSSNRRSSESEDRTSTTSYASADVGYKGKGKARATDWDVESTLSGPARRSSLRTHPLSAPSPWVAPGAGGVGEPGPSSSSSSSRAYPLSGDQSWLDRLKSLAAPLIHGYGKGRARRLFHLVLALSIPLFGLLLANEMRISAYRTRLQRGFGPLENRTGEWEAVDPDGVALSLVDFRVGYSKKRRRELLEDRNPNGAALRLWPSPDGPEWSETDEATLSAGARQHWPAWWGSTDDVGASPYDHVPVPANGEKKRLLFLTSESRVQIRSRDGLAPAGGLTSSGYKDYLERMNTHTYEIVDGMSGSRGNNAELQPVQVHSGLTLVQLLCAIRESSRTSGARAGKAMIRTSRCRLMSNGALGGSNSWNRPRRSMKPRKGVRLDCEKSRRNGKGHGPGDCLAYSARRCPRSWRRSRISSRTGWKATMKDADPSSGRLCGRSRTSPLLILRPTRRGLVLTRPAISSSSTTSISMR